MKQLISFFFLFAFANLAFTQTIPTTRVYDWKHAGLAETLPAYTQTINLQVLGADNTGIVPSDAVYLTAINQCTVIGQSYNIYFPAGVYTFSNTISLKNNVELTGDNSNTHLVFKTPNSCVNLSGYQTSIPSYSLIQNANRYQNYLLTTPLSGSVTLTTGDFLVLKQRAATLVTSNWAYNSVGQFFKINGVTADTLNVNHEMRKDYLITDTISIYKTTPIQNAGIKCLKITRSNSAVNQVPTVQFLYAYNCFLEGVEMDSCFFSHVTLEQSGNCQISGSYFHDAYDYGGGGRAYGVVMQYNSTDHKIENNIFNHLRHSILCQAGANGNVIDYNYSINPYWTGVSLPASSAGDLVLHGNYVYANLFEGNVCQNIVIDDSHGQNGPHNTFFRNRAKLYGIFMNTAPASNNQNFVGNEITSTALFTGLYSLAGTGHFQYANKKQGTLTPAGTGTLTDVSYCYNSAPGFLIGYNWPTIGLPNVYNTGSIPAENRNATSNKTLCDALTTSIQSLNTSSSFLIFPNPTRDILYIKSTVDAISTIEITDILGKSVFYSSYSETVNLPHLSSGIYVLSLKKNNIVIHKQKISIYN